MPTQKLFKQRVRARMTQTGESYTSARQHLLRKAEGAAAEPQPATAPETVSPEVMGVSDESMVRATGKTHAEWFAVLDAWGATDHGHTEIARWLREEQGVPPWWTQSVTVAYERARGIRGRHQMRDGYSVSATKIVAVDPARALLAFTDETVRAGWLPGAPLEPRPTRARLTARFAWHDPPSRVVVVAAPRDDGRTTVSVTHDQVQDAAKAQELKAFWRERLGELKSTLEAG